MPGYAGCPLLFAHAARRERIHRGLVQEDAYDGRVRCPLGRSLRLSSVTPQQRWRPSAGKQHQGTYEQCHQACPHHSSPPPPERETKTGPSEHHARRNQHDLHVEAENERRHHAQQYAQRGPASQLACEILMA